jgi:hypothetical protein
MFFNRNYIPAVPIREEQRLSEEEELARQLKREARIFFPDKKLPDFDTEDLPPLPKEQQGARPPQDLPPEQKARLPEREKAARPADARDGSPDGEEGTRILKDHDAVCREEDSLWRKTDGSFSHHEVETARQEAEQIAKKKQQMISNSQSVNGNTGSQIGGVRQNACPRLNKQDLKQGIRLQVILDKPRGLKPWKEDNF